MITLKRFAYNLFQVNTYVLHDETKECIIIDAGMDGPMEENEISGYIESLQLKPVFAVLTGLYLYVVVYLVKKRDLGGRSKFFGNLLFAFAIIQGLAGGVTILTLAPLYMQITHLLLADIFWITLVLFSLESVTEPARRS